MTRSIRPLRLSRPLNNYSSADRMDLGVKVFDWGDASVNGSTGGVSTVASPVNGSSVSAKFTPTNATCRTNIGSVGTPLAWPTRGDLRGFGMWAYTDSPTPVNMEVLITADNFANFSRWQITIAPGTWAYHTMPIGSRVNSGTGFPLGTNIQIIRIASGATGVDTPTLAVNGGLSVYIGGFYQNPPTRAKFCIGFDDYDTSLVTAQGFSIAGGDGVSTTHSYMSFVESYGWKMTYHAQAGNLALNVTGATGGAVMTTAQVDSFYQRGHTVATQSYYSPIATDIGGAVSNAGTRLLGPYGFGLNGGAAFTCTETGLSVRPTNNYTRILEDQTLARDYLVSKGWDTARRHFSTNQGSLDLYINQAIYEMGWKTIRPLIAGNVPGFMLGPIAATVQTHNAGLGYLTNCPTAIQCDSAGVADATITAYVDMIIAAGGIGCSYSHSFNVGTSGPKTKVLCDYLKTKERQGLIDIVSAEQLYRQSIQGQYS